VDINETDSKWTVNDEVIEFLGKTGLKSLKKYEASIESLFIIIIRHCVYDKNIICIEELRDQLQKMGILEHMQTNFELYEYLLCGKASEVEAETVIKLFDQTSLSVEGSNDGSSERDTIFYLNQFLRKCGNHEVVYNDHVVTLEMVLEFLTGGNFIPFGGFWKKIDFDFYNAQFKTICNPLPKSSTCNLIFTCPRNSPKYQSFENVMKLVVMECKDFGQI
jgi:hypothetical protein